MKKTAKKSAGRNGNGAGYTVEYLGETAEISKVWRRNDEGDDFLLIDGVPSGVESRETGRWAIRRESGELVDGFSSKREAVDYFFTEVARELRNQLVDDLEAELRRYHEEIATETADLPDEITELLDEVFSGGGYSLLDVHTAASYLRVELHGYEILTQKDHAGEYSVFAHGESTDAHHGGRDLGRVVKRGSGEWVSYEPSDWTYGRGHDRKRDAVDCLVRTFADELKGETLPDPDPTPEPVREPLFDDMKTADGTVVRAFAGVMPKLTNDDDPALTFAIDGLTLKDYQDAVDAIRRSIPDGGGTVCLYGETDVYAPLGGIAQIIVRNLLDRTPADPDPTEQEGELHAWAETAGDLARVYYVPGRPIGKSFDLWVCGDDAIFYFQGSYETGAEAREAGREQGFDLGIESIVTGDQQLADDLRQAAREQAQELGSAFAVGDVVRRASGAHMSTHYVVTAISKTHPDSTITHLELRTPSGTKTTLDDYRVTGVSEALRSGHAPKTDEDRELSASVLWDRFAEEVGVETSRSTDS